MNRCGGIRGAMLMAAVGIGVLFTLGLIALVA